MIKIAGILLFIIFLISCTTEKKSEYVISLEKNHEYLMKNEIDSIFGAGYRFYVTQEMNLASTIDLITTMNSKLSEDSILTQKLNKKVVKWLADSIFIIPSNKYNGVFKIDTTNLLLLTDELQYYMDSSIQESFNLDDHLLYYNDATSHKISIDEHQFYYDIVPVKKEYLGIEGKYVLQSTDDYLFYGTKRKRVLCKKYLVDWYLTVSSEMFSNEELAIKFSDTTLHFSSGYLK